MKLISPETEDDLKQYYHLRWCMLREPWGQAEGSERDENDAYAYHIMAVINGSPAGVARLEFLAEKQAQLRYMAVDNQFQKQGVGRKIIEHMEDYARQNNANELFLNSREIALGFYEKRGFKVTQKSYLLYDSIQHYKMNKRL